MIGFVITEITKGLNVGSVGVWLAFSWLSSVFSGLITFPFISAVIAVIYIDLRVRKEALDIELLASALGNGAVNDLRERVHQEVGKQVDGGPGARSERDAVASTSSTARGALAQTTRGRLSWKRCRGTWSRTTSSAPRGMRASDRSAGHRRDHE